MADQASQPAGGLACRWHADDDILSAAQPVQQDCEAAEQSTKDAYADLGAEFANVRHQASVKQKIQPL